jgi:hypothetical protein
MGYNFVAFSEYLKFKWLYLMVIYFLHSDEDEEYKQQVQDLRDSIPFGKFQMY